MDFRTIRAGQFEIRVPEMNWDEMKGQIHENWERFQDLWDHRTNPKWRRIRRQLKRGEIRLGIGAVAALMLVVSIKGHHRAKVVAETQIRSIEKLPNELHVNCYRHQMVEACQALGAYYVRVGEPENAQQTFDHACALGDGSLCRGHSQEDTVVTSDPAPAATRAAASTGNAGAVVASHLEMSELLPERPLNGEIVEIGVDPKITNLAARFALATKDPVLGPQLMKKAKPGEPLPYDPRMGLTQAEYAVLLAGMNKMRLQPVRQVTISIARETGGRLALRSPAHPILADGFIFDERANSLSLPSMGQQTGRYFMNRKSPIAPNDGYEWSFKQLNPSRSKSVQVTLSKLLSEDKCLLTVDSIDSKSTNKVKDSIYLRFDCAGKVMTKTASN
jgi:hypothetical protein